jgi:hypothetical protein
MSTTLDIANPTDSDWPITNCYVDAWMLVLADWGLDPVAGLGMTVALDYEGDQFTFFKYLHSDLETLYGVVAGELTIYGSLERHIAEQLSLGRLVLAEADGYYLPDTRATSYRTTHTKTTIGIDSIDVERGRLRYRHNEGRYELTGADYDGALRRLPEQQAASGALPPYAEFVKRRFPPLRGPALTEAAADLLRRHLARRPEADPIRRYRADFARHMQWLLDGPDSFHDYAFAVFRQLGANFQLLARHLEWLRARGLRGFEDPRNAATAISAAAKTLQFKVARIAARRRVDPCPSLFDELERQYAALIGGLERVLR